jgi:hypothetical protein
LIFIGNLGFFFDIFDQLFDGGFFLVDFDLFNLEVFLENRHLFGGIDEFGKTVLETHNHIGVFDTVFLQIFLVVLQEIEVIFRSGEVFSFHLLLEVRGELLYRHMH